MAEIEVTKTLLDDVKRFTDAKWKHHECEICGIENWGIFPEDHVYMYVPVAADRTNPFRVMPPLARPILPLSCQNCGNVRLIDKEVFEEWRTEQWLQATKSSS